MLGFAPIAATPLGTPSPNESFVMQVTSGTFAVSYQGAGKLITDVYPSGTFTLDGRAVGLTAQRPFPVDAEAFSVSGQDVELDYGFGIVVDSGSYTLTGQDVVLDTGFGIVVDSGSFTLTEQDINIHISMNAVNGSFTVTGQNIPKGISEAFDEGSFSITGRDADFTVQRLFVIDNGSYTVTGYDFKFRGFFSPYVPPEIWTEVA
jgi:hypothetical protein